MMRDHLLNVWMIRESQIFLTQQGESDSEDIELLTEREWKFPAPAAFPGINTMDSVDPWCSVSRAESGITRTA